MAFIKALPSTVTFILLTRLRLGSSVLVYERASCMLRSNGGCGTIYQANATLTVYIMIGEKYPTI